ncbi:contactin-5-like isoform X2 [Oscarella lobularis]|uniref:contactin-5-like isoform X2 n=1 Tax=Oscarella lobularis TaxID=121494 RepID=UPI00331362BC
MNSMTGESVFSKTGTLTVYAPDEAPQFVESLTNQIVVEGSSILIPCRVQGNPHPMISWQIAGNDANESLSSTTIFPNGSIFVNDVTLMKSQLNVSYRCVASNRAGTATSPYITVKAAYWTSTFLAVPGAQTAIVGNQVVLRCRPPDSRPKAVVTWYKMKGQNLAKLTADVIFQQDSDLVIRTIQKSDEGDYLCSAENMLLQRSALSSSARLTVLVPPEIVSFSNAVHSIVVGESIKLECNVARGDPAPVLNWQRNGQNVTSNSSLEIKNADTGKEGNYTCLAVNKAGKDIASVYIEILVPPTFTFLSSNLTVVEGSRVNLTCQAAGKPEPTITWINSLGNVFIRAHFILDTVLRNESGDYTCVAANAAQRIETKIQMTVLYPSKITSFPMNVTVVSGNEARFYCEADGQPRPNIFWFSSSFGNFISIGPELVLFNVTLDMMDGYECRAVNHVGNASAIGYLTVQSPALILLPPFDVKIPVGNPLYLPCNFSGVPTPRVKWLKDGSPLSAGSHVSIASSGKLTLLRPNISDSGVYTCTIENVVAIDSASAVITIQGFPTPPLNLQALPLSSSAVRITWQPPSFDGNSNLTLYSIRYKRREAISWNAISQRSTLPTHYTVVSLSAYTEYEFSVAALNEIGQGPFSNVALITTNQSASATPRLSSVATLNSTAVYVAWLAPNPLNGVLQGYELRYRLNDSPAFFYKDFDRDRQNGIVGDLTPFTLYSFQLRALTGNQSLFFSNWSLPLLSQTAEGVPLASPSNVSMIAVNSSSLSLLFTGPSSKLLQGSLRGFTIAYWPTSNENDSLQLDIRGPTSSAVLTQLRPWTSYTAQIRVFNSVAAGPFSKSVESRTHQGVPSLAPANLSSNTTGPDTIFVFWLPVSGSSINGILQGYNVYVRRLGAMQSENVTVVRNGTTVLLYHLEIFTTYEISVAAFTEAGDGPSASVIKKTGEGAPSAPPSLQIVSLTSSQVVLTWLEPVDKNGVLLGYEVYYRSTGSQSDSTLTTNDTRILVDDLDSGTNYTASVAARTAYGTGLKSYTITFRTNETNVTVRPTATSMMKTPTSAPSLPGTTRSTTSSHGAITSASAFKYSISSATPTASEDDSAFVRNVIIACSCVGVVIVIVAFVACCCCCEKCRSTESGRYKVRHVDDDTTVSEDVSPAWNLGIGDNIVLKKADINRSTEMMTFQDSYMTSTFTGDTPRKKTNSTEKLEVGYDLSPIARFESDAGSAKPKGRPPSMPGPSPYSSNEHLYTSSEHV